MLKSFEQIMTLLNHKNPRTNVPKHRRCQVELLEERTLLSALPLTASEYSSLRAQYADFDLPANMANINVITLDLAEGDGLAELKNAINTAKAGTGPDLIVVRTSSDHSDDGYTLKYQSKTDVLEIINNDNNYSFGALTIVSLGPKNLTLDGGGVSSVMTISDKNPYNSARTVVNLGGLSIVNGNSKGISFYSRNGIGSLTMMNCIVSDNIGGGLNADMGTISLKNSQFLRNQTTSMGGGIYLDHSNVTITNCTISGNQASSGGGIYSGNYQKSLTITNCTISENNARQGGGIYIYNSAATITNSTISKNTAYDSGGGIRSTGNLTLKNSVIWGNTATTSGGGISLNNQVSTVTITNCTISGNAADGKDGKGGGIYNFGDGKSQTITNSIVSMNYAKNGQDIYGKISQESHNNHIGYFESFVNHPVFENGKLTNTDSVDLHLRSDSYAINAGDNSAASGISKDLDGYNRIYGTTVDIGAYEFRGNRTGNSYSSVVNTLNDSFDPNDGEWSLREAIYYAPNYATITFAENLLKNLENGAKATITLSDDLVIGKAVVINGGGLVAIDGNEKRYFIRIESKAADEQLVFSGLTIQNSKGIRNEFGVFTVTDCIVSKNSAKGGGKLGYGGGIFNESGQVTVENSQISNNEAGSWGGGIYNSDGTLIVINSTISENTGGTSGGGIYNDSGVLTVLNSTIGKNTVGTNGGGIYIKNAETATITSSRISENTAYQSGGGIMNCYNGLTVTNSAILLNEAKSGGGIYHTNKVTLTNVTIAGNKASKGGGLWCRQPLYSYNSIILLNTADEGAEIYVESSGSVNGFNNLSTFASWKDGKNDNNQNNFFYEADQPLFFDTSDEERKNWDFRLSADSQAIDLGNDQYANAAGIDTTGKDLAGQPRKSGSSIDIGAYESIPLGMSQHGVFVDQVDLFWKKDNNVASVRLTWEQGTEKTELGTFTTELYTSWDTKPFPNGYGTLVFDNLDSNGNVIKSSSLTGLILNDDQVVVHYGSISSPETWTSGKVHVVVGKLDIKSTLTISPNTVVKFWKGSYLNVNEGATVTINDNVTFTRIEDDTIGGDTNQDGALHRPDFGNDYIRGTGTIDIVSPNSFTRKYLVFTASGTISQNGEIWDSGQVYHVTGDITIPKGATLTINPGAIVKFDPGTSITVSNGGVLNAQGTSALPIIFTSVKDDSYGGDTDEDGQNAPQPGDWKSIYVSGTAVIKNAILQYGAPGNESGIVAVQYGGNVTIDSCRILHAKYDGLWNWGGTLNVSNTVISDVGICTAPYKGTQSFVNCTFDSSNYALMYWRRTWPGTASYINCIFNQMASGWIDSLESNAWQNKLSFSNCVFYSTNPERDASFPFIGSNGNIWANPLFRDEANGDYRLRAGSPCIDAGTNVGAPETDFMGNPRYDDPNMVNNGGSCVDIGAFEFVEGAPSNIDLEPINLQSPTSVTSGETATLLWTVSNNGSVTAKGAWTDAIYLVNPATGQSVLVKEYTHTGNIAAGQVQTFMTDVIVPGVTEGSWKFSVAVNENSDIFEGINSANNTIVSTSAVTVSVPALTNGTAFTVRKGEPKLLKLVVAAGQSYDLTVSSDSPVTVWGRSGFTPTSTVYDSQAIETSNGQYVLPIEGKAAQQTVYVLVTSNSKQANVTLSTSNAGFTLLSTSTPSVGNGGKATIDFTGTGFTSGMTVKLTSGNTTITASEITINSSTSASAKFDLTGRATGTYTLTVTQNGTTRQLNNAVVVTQSVNQTNSVKAWIESTSEVRLGRVYKGVLHYQNQSNNDIFAPIFMLSGPELGLDAENLSSCTLALVGIGSSNTAGILKPGEEGQITFYYKCTKEGELSLSQLEDSSNSYTDKFTWRTPHDYYIDISNAATRINKLEPGIVSLEEIQMVALLTMEENTYSISGSVIDVNTGELIVNKLLYVQDYNNNSNAAIGTPYTVHIDSNGHFLIMDLPQNTRVVISEDYSMTGQQWSFTVTGNDLCNVIIQAQKENLKNGSEDLFYIDLSPSIFENTPIAYPASVPAYSANDTVNNSNSEPYFELISPLKTDSDDLKIPSTVNIGTHTIKVEINSKDPDGRKLDRGRTGHYDTDGDGIKDTYIITINSSLNDKKRREAFEHELYHLNNNYFYNGVEDQNKDSNVFSAEIGAYTAGGNWSTNKANEQGVSAKDKKEYQEMAAESFKRVQNYTNALNQFKEVGLENDIDTFYKACISSRHCTDRFLTKMKKDGDMTTLINLYIKDTMNEGKPTWQHLRSPLTTEEDFEGTFLEGIVPWFKSLKFKIALTSFIVLHSTDPNELSGPVGGDFVTHNAGTQDEPFLVIDGKNWITNSSETSRDYTIYFENKSTATAAAQEIRVTTQLPEEMDWNTFQTSVINIGGEVFTLSDDNLISENTWLVNQSATGNQIKITSNLNNETGEVEWYLRSWVDSTFDHYPESAYDGFLKPNDDSHRGEGFITFTVNYDEGLANGTTVALNSTIVFDVNPPITTNTWLNTLDAVAPTVQIKSATATAGGATLKWAGSDNTNGSGVASYSVYVSVNGASPELWKTFTADASGAIVTSASYTGAEAGNSLQFTVYAVDAAGWTSLPAVKTVTVKQSNSNQATYNTTQTGQIKTFLEQKDANGVKNGLKINVNYNPDDPSTWTGVTWEEIDGKIQPTAINWTGLCLVGSANLSQLTYLKSLAITGLSSEIYGGLTSLNISGCTNLTSLNLYYNQLKTLDLTKNTKLMDLDCTGNQIASLNLTKNTLLTYLRVYENQLKTLDVTKNVNLVYLITCYNQLTTLDLSQNTKLEWLQCYNNRIVSLDLTNNERLRELICWNPTLESVLLNPSAIGNVNTRLCVADNTPWTFSNSAGTVLKTTSSDSPYFLISELPVIAVNQAGTQTISFEMADNSTYDEAECAQIKAFLNQRGNGAKVNPAYSPNDPSTWGSIEWVEVDGVKHAFIIDWTGLNLAGSADFSNFKYMKILAITGESQENPGDLTSLNITGCTALEGCDCYYNKLTSLDLTTNTKLIGIVCNDNLLTSLNFSQNKDLAWVDCQTNRLTTLDVSKNQRLTHLSCSFNQIGSLDLTQNPSLTTLQCNSNQITSLCLAQNTKLSNLRCWNENLTSVVLPENPAESFTIDLYWGYWSGWTYRNSQGRTALSRDVYVPTEIPFTAIINTERQFIEFTCSAAEQYELNGLTLSNTLPKFGEPITATVPQATATVTYQWYRGNTAIPDATANSYTPTLADLGNTLKCTATGTGLYSGTVFAVTDIVTKNSLDTPEISSVCIEGKNISVGWDAVDNAETYKVEYRIANAAKWTTKTGIKTTSFSFAGKVGSVYEVRVTAIPGKQSGYEDSEFAEATAAFTKTLNNLKLKNTFLGDDNASVSVTGIDASATHLVVKLDSDTAWVPVEGGTVRIGSVRCNFQDGTLFFMDLTSNTKFTLEVQQMINDPGVSVRSAAAKSTLKTTKMCYNVPQNVTAEAVSDTQVEVCWSTVTGKSSTQPAASYTVQYSIAGKNKWSTASSKAVGDSFIVSKLKGNTSYEFRVFASKDSAFLASDYSELAEAVTLPTAPKIASVKTTLAGTALLTWNKDTGVEFFEIRYAITGTNDWETVQVPATTEKKMTYTFSGLTSGKSYEFQIRALDYQLTFSAWSASKVLSKVK